jgi:hypothetical protein
LQKLKFYFIDKEKSFFSFDLKRIFIQLQPKKEFARFIRILSRISADKFDHKSDRMNFKPEYALSTETCVTGRTSTT